MPQLLPCPGCGRHVRVSDRACPFCGSSQPTAASSSLWTVALLGLSLVACTGTTDAPTKPADQKADQKADDKAEPATPVAPGQTSGAPTPSAEGTTGAEPDADAETSEGTDDGAAIVEQPERPSPATKYGAPRPMTKYGAPPNGF